MASTAPRIAPSTAPRGLGCETCAQPGVQQRERRLRSRRPDVDRHEVERRAAPAHDPWQHGRSARPQQRAEQHAEDEQRGDHVRGGAAQRALPGSAGRIAKAGVSHSRRVEQRPGQHQPPVAERRQPQRARASATPARRSPGKAPARPARPSTGASARQAIPLRGAGSALRREPRRAVAQPRTRAARRPGARKQLPADHVKRHASHTARGSRIRGGWRCVALLAGPCSEV